MKTTFKQFLKDNWEEMVEIAEKSTGENYTGREPLLSKDDIIEIAKEVWLSKLNSLRGDIKKELNMVILPVEVPKEEFKRVTNYLLTIGWFDKYIEPTKTN